MGLFWEAVKSFGAQWGGATSAMYTSDTVIKNMTGIDPKRFHPDIYKNITRAINDKYQFYFRLEMPLTDEEVTMLKLTYFCELAAHAEDEDTRRKFGDAIAKLRRIAGGRIQAEISAGAAAQTGF